jgi:hypothetical protein
MKEKIMNDLATIWLGIMGFCLAAIICKLTYDFVGAPNVFAKKEGVLTQRQMDDMCVAWWFDSDLTSARKRVCGK